MTAALGAHVLVAPDAFKGTFSAADVAAAIGAGLDDAGVVPDLCPVADGGEGTLAALAGRLGATVVRTPAHDPLGREIAAEFGWIADSATAIVETASASGFALVARDERDAWAASTGGTGEVLAAALAHGARTVVLGAGGSATTDGGAGALAAVAAKGGFGDARIVVLCDVNTSFERAAAMFGPQKGADPPTVIALERRLHELAGRLPRDPCGVAMTGCAGGLSGALWAAAGATLVPGAAWVLDTLDFDARLRGVSAVVTGEGRIDQQTLDGKLISEIARRAQAAGVPLYAVVARNDLDAISLERARVMRVFEAGTLTAIAAAGAQLGRTLRREPVSRPARRHHLGRDPLGHGELRPRPENERKSWNSSV